jgi:CRISPR-associated exonuclease Cas4
MEDENVYITTSDVIEYLFCPRFTYYMHCLEIPQNEGSRFKVQKGRHIHEIREKTNTEYLRKKLGCVEKVVGVKLYSKKQHIRGIVDEILFLEDGTAAPIDYKYTEYKEKTFRTHKYQAAIYSMLIEENYGKQVNKAYLCYARSNNKIKEITITEKDYKKAIKAIGEVLDIIQNGLYPKKTKYSRKCIDCCYRRICT